MVIGDIIQVTEFGFAPEDDRDVGIVLTLDTFRSHHYEPLEKIAEILWSNGTVGWINLDRILVLHANKSRAPI